MASKLVATSTPTVMQNKIPILERYRLRTGKTLEKVAAIAEVSVSAVQKWEKGHTRPKPKNRLKYAEALSVSVDAIIDAANTEVSQ